MSAHTPGLASVLEPVLWTGFGIGFAAGMWSGFRGAHPGRAIAWAVGFLLVAIVGYSWLMPAPLADAFMAYTLVVPFAGALPLGVGFYLGVSASALIKRRAAGAKSDNPDDHES
jgi:hypothetical protein